MTLVPMQVIETVQAMRALSREWRARGERIGFVPTMGALHQGHASLVRASRGECARTVVSVFVNPTQFGPGEDFGRYPRTWDADCRMLAAEGVDAVFRPAVAEVYPAGHATFVDQAGPALVLEGVHRPGHFRGVLTVVLKLFTAVEPDLAYFGAKDYQQTVVVSRMAQDLALPLSVRVCPTVREPDGLAMSSRNRFLSAEARRRALCLWEALRGVRAAVEAGVSDPVALAAGMVETLRLRAPEARIDYSVVVHPRTLEPIRDLSEGGVALLALHLGGVRLIDNLVLEARSK